MKKFLFFILCLFSFTLVNAKVYEVKDTDLSIDLDDNYWLVLERDNYEEIINSNDYSDQIKELIKERFSEPTINIYAISKDEDNNLYDFFVSSLPFEEITNINSFSNDDLKEILNETINEYSTVYEIKDSGIYKDKYTYLFSDYIGNGMYIEYYYTIINNIMYRVYLRHGAQNTDPVLNIRDDILDNIKFKAIYKPLDDIEYKSSSFLVKLLDGDLKTILYLVVPIVVLIVIIIITKKNKTDKELKDKNNEFWN